MGNKDLYSVLGVTRNASAQEIKTAYRKMSLKYHPDRQGGKSDAEKKEAEEKFKEIAEAYGVLSDPQKKQQYDTFGTMDFSGQGGFSGFDAEDLFNIFKGTGSFRDEFNNIQRGRDKKLNISLTLEELYRGGMKTVTHKVMRPCDDCGGRGSLKGAQVTCPHCGGTGMVRQRQQFGPMSFMESTHPCPHCGGSGYIIKDPCSKCGGTGLVETNETIEVMIPEIDRLKYRYKVEGKGHSCPNNNGGNGDLYYVFQVVEGDSDFHFDEQNPTCIRTSINVNVFDCMLGCKKVIKGVGGYKTHEIEIPAGAVNGDTVRVKGEGFRYNRGLRGDLIVEIKMMMPKGIGNDARKKINELKEIINNEE